MRITILAAAIVATGLATAASAQDTSFRGFRIEGNAGWDQYRTGIGNNGKFAYGGSGGFDGQIGRVVIGPEFSYWHPNDDRNTVGITTATGGQRYRESGDQLGAAVRIGYLVTPDLLVFGKGGYVNDAQRRLAFAPDGTLSRFSRGHADGYQAGGGAEYTLHDRFAFAPVGLYVSAQYVYANYDNHTTDRHAMGGIGLRFR